MTNCPSCGGEAMSAFAKSFLGPARSAKCKSCDARIGTSWKGLWTAVPFVAIMVAAAVFLGSGSYLVAIPLIVVNAYVWYKLVPLELREPKPSPAAD